MGDIAMLPLRVLVVYAPEHVDTPAGHAVLSVVEDLRDSGVEILDAPGTSSGMALAAAEADLHAVLIDWRLPDESDGISGARRVVTFVREHNEHVPVFLMAGRDSVQAVPTDLIHDVSDFLYPLDDTAGWQAGRVRDAALRYRRELLPPMFAALAAFAETHEYSWHTPGHEGGAAFRKSSVGRMFWEFFGEQTFRSDISISVGEVGSLLDHSGPIGEAEMAAARIFGADRTYFVTNGTSTSNRVVYQASVVGDDVVVCDRNAHKSIEQANTITHARPVYMIPTRNRYGIIGPIPPSEMTRDAIDRKVAGSPLARGRGAPVLATVTNSTYDGLLYHVPTVDRTLGSHVDRIHYDEAWYGYAAFNPLYHERHAMHVGARAEGGPTTFATQSTHKLLAALSQASYVHIRDGRSPVDHPRYNEAFMMHASTSPLYAIIASNDVAAKMMEGRSGLTLTRDSIEEAVGFRQTVARIGRDLGDDWFFSCWQPDDVPDPASRGRVPFADAAAELLVTSPDAWLLREGDAWHGFEGLPDGYAMLDPIKVTVLTPGMRPDGTLDASGIPAALVTAYLDQRASIVVEKTQDYSILFLFSMGVTRGKWGTLVTALFEFKQDYDANTALRDALPATHAADPGRFGSMGLRDLATEMHAVIAGNNQMAKMHAAFSALPTPDLPNHEAYAHMVRGTIEPVRLADMAGRTVAVGVVPYPPGIPLLMPGENAGAAGGDSLAYLGALQEFDRTFPVFEHDLHGVDHVDGDYVVRCVAG
jgi:lysine decarboxylase/arginine decarboxylase